jgi:hypothetical protein
MIRGCQCSRDRAIIAILYESGCRCGELAELTWGDVIIDDLGIKLYVTDSKMKHKGKVSKRFNRLIGSSEYLMTWKRDYPGDANTKESLVFITERGNPLQYQTLTSIIKRAAKRAGIKKSVNKLHTFRKSRCTNMINEGYSESTIKNGLWGNTETNMFRTYLKRKEKDIDAEFLSHHGLVQEKTNKEFTAIRCANCNSLNNSEEEYCFKCSTPLTEESRKRIQNFQELIKSRPDLLVELFNRHLPDEIGKLKIQY